MAYDHYLDIQLLPDPEFPAHQLWAALYAKLHRALVAQQGGQIGLTFPGYSDRPPGLGAWLRLFGPASALDRLMSTAWLRGMRDHVSIGPVSAVPAQAAARTLRRVQAKSSPERLRRRQMARHGLSAEDAARKVPDSAAEKLQLPFVQLCSASTGQTFRIYLRLGPPLPQAQQGLFNAYGLSAVATVPWF